MNELMWLLNGKFSSLSVSFNEMHAGDYLSAQEYHDQTGTYGPTSDESLIDWVSEEERLNALKHNSVWIIQWYPDTPVGFHMVGASTFEAALDHAFEVADIDVPGVDDSN